MTTPWNFVEKYYPNYDSCDDIAENNDFCKIINGQLDGYAEEMYNEEAEQIYGATSGMLSATEVHKRVIDIFQQRLDKSNATIYEEAIKGYIKTLHT